MDCYNIGGLLGEGGFGRMYEGARIEDGTRTLLGSMSSMGTSVPMELMLFNKVRTVDGVIIILDLLGRKQVYLRELWTNTGHETFSNRLSRLPYL